MSGNPATTPYDRPDRADRADRADGPGTAGGPDRPDGPDGPDGPRRSERRAASASEAARGPGRLLAGLLLLGAAGLSALVVRSDVADPPFQELDERWLVWMGGPHEGLYRAAATALDWFGGPVGALVPLSLLILLLVRRRWASVGFLLTVYFGGNMLVVQSLKHLVDRPRPADPLVRVDHGSFPSGHAATAALLVIVVGALLVPAARRRAWWLGGAVFTLAMMWSRTWLHAHWISDTAAGAAAGAGAGLLVWWLFHPALARERVRTHERRAHDRRGAAAGAGAAVTDGG
ncbi:phosphatase PAP2 family protein [Streptomyces sp. NBC_01294]|uniref:phosphatase PAP2 family protein n=1 Tax=Streptomyces sp. NBC_01294 TaxID=2903815 RepID=UPI002DDA3552|nr:phosphatase PAP2 family protein [Streptomyces sp. NBC_01294]WRZ55463.1 phosphatase PAP2 family protein [Streptomyces sp. NBC_01294]WRZ61234.1 phosphatase PAP2 family protein [Streptomyces sp. NBC_01294]